MDMIDQLNKAMAYIEETLEESVDWNAAAKIACLDTASFKRLFCCMTGMTPAEYVRRRRLTRAADDLRAGESVIDTAMKYGWNSADAFSRAFRRWHGLAPDHWRKGNAAAIVCPPVSFTLTIKGEKAMTMTLTNLPETTICGLSAPFDETLYPTREALRHALWADTCEDVPGRICGVWNEKGSAAMDGVWYGLWRGSRYLIAREADRLRQDISEPVERQIVPAGLFAVFATARGHGKHCRRCSIRSSTAGCPPPATSGAVRTSSSGCICGRITAGAMPSAIMKSACPCAGRALSPAIFRNAPPLAMHGLQPARATARCSRALRKKIAKKRKKVDFTPCKTATNVL